MPLQDLHHIKALTFDVFGTVVDWRTTVESALRTALARKFTQLNPQQQVEIRYKLLPHNNSQAQDKDWASLFAQEWRNAYKQFVFSFRADETTPWKDIDTHHHDSLVEQLSRWDLEGIFTAEEIKNLSLVWHHLTPWPDSSAGLALLKEQGLVASTLSNGTTSLLSDLNSEGNLAFSKTMSADDFGAYKPDPRVYLGAAEKLGVKPEEVAMVAAHLNDLEAARVCGLRTVYVERKEEEDWRPDEERYQKAKEWVDLWVGLDQDEDQDQDRVGKGGFVEAARQLGGVLKKK